MAHQPRSSTGCVICDRGEPRDVLVELPSTWVTAALEAPLPGYVCSVSKVHVAEPYELTGAARSGFWDDVSKTARAVQTMTRSPKLNYEIHGNTIPHLHLHVYPRYRGDPYVGRPIDPSSARFVRSPADLRRIANAVLEASDE